MKKNNGFTLIELLATIIILAAVALVAFPILLNTIKNSEDKIDGVTRQIVESAAKLYVDDNLNEYSNTSGNTYCIPLNKLIEENHLEKGILDAANINYSEKTVKVTVTDNYNYEIVNSGECTVYLAKLCTYIPQTGTTEKTVGAQYKCDIKTPEEDTTFYVLGENVNDSTKIDLIMDRNFTDGTVDETLAWCIDGGTTNNCKNINSKEENPLKHIQDTFGDSVEVSFPTKDQITSANNGNSSNLPQWLYDYLDGTIHSQSGVYGYWTASPYPEGPYPDGASDAWYVFCNGNVGIRNVDNSLNDGVRPVITISKDEL